MIDSRWRGIFQPVFNKISKVFIHFNIKPDTITISAFMTGLVSGGCVALGKPFLSIIFLWMSGLLDVLDGSVARLTGNSSRAGAYMDLILDRMVEAALILGFAWYLPEHYFAYLLFFVSLIFNFTTFIVAGALFKNTKDKSMYYDTGIAERTETFIVFTLMLIIPQYTFYILMTFNLIIFITGAQRFLKVIRYAKSK